VLWSSGLQAILKFHIISSTLILVGRSHVIIGQLFPFLTKSYMLCTDLRLHVKFTGKNGYVMNDNSPSDDDGHDDSEITGVSTGVANIQSTGVHNTESETNVDSTGMDNMETYRENTLDSTGVYNTEMDMGTYSENTLDL